MQSTDLKLFATGFYGVAKTLGMVIFSFLVADHFGRRKVLIWGAFVGAVPMVRNIHHILSEVHCLILK